MSARASLYLIVEKLIVLFVVYMFSAGRFRSAIEIPNKLKSVVVLIVLIVVSSSYRCSRRSSLVENTATATVCGSAVVVITSVVSYVCNRVRFFFSDGKKVLDYARWLLISSSSSKVIVVVVVVGGVVIVDPAVHAKLRVSLNY
jgi:hypothetical protein